MAGPLPAVCTPGWMREGAQFTHGACVPRSVGPHSPTPMASVPQVDWRPGWLLGFSGHRKGGQAQNSDQTHAISDQPKIQLANRTACISGLPLPFCRAIHAGASMITNNNNTQIAYFRTNKISVISIILCIKKGGWYMPPNILYGMIIYHILRFCPVLLQCELTDCILPYDLFLKLNLF